MAKKVESKAVAVVTKDNDLVASVNTSSAMAKLLKIDPKLMAGYVPSTQGDNKELFQNDIIIPKIWLTQQMSDAFKNGEAKLGEYIASLSKEVLSEAGELLQFIVLTTFKRWHTFSVDAKGDKEFLKSELITIENLDLPYEDVIEGENVTRRQVICAYVLLVKDVKKKLNVPYVLEFASTSKGAGRTMISDVATIEKGGNPSWAGIFSLGAHEESKDKHDFYVKDVKFEGFINTNNTELVTHLADCYQSITSLVAAGVVKIDDSDVNKDQTEEDLDNKAADSKASRAAKAKI